MRLPIILLLGIFILINPVPALDIAALVAAAGILTDWVFGDYAILALLAVRPAIDHWRDVVLLTYQSINININALLSLGTALFAGIFLFRNRKLLKKIPLKWTWLIFLGIALISVAYSHSPGETATEFIKAMALAGIFGMSYLLARHEGENYRTKLFGTFAFAAAIPIVLGLVQFITGTGLMIDGVPNRIYGTFAHPNILATFAVLTFIVMVEAWEFRRPSWAEGHPVAANILALATLLALAFTYTRIAWLSWLTFVLIIGFLRARWLTLRLTVVVTVLYLLFFPINAILESQFNTSLKKNPLIARITERSEDSDSISWRVDVYNKVVPLIVRRPLFGYGYGTFASVWDNYKGVKNIWDNTSEAHNDYLKLALEIGIAGLAAFLALFIGMFRRAWAYGKKHHFKNAVFIASIPVYLVLSLSDNMLHHTPVIWWLWALWGMWLAEEV